METLLLKSVDTVVCSQSWHSGNLSGALTSPP